MEKRLVISGLSGRFPESDNLEEFTNNLFNGVDMITGKLQYDTMFEQLIDRMRKFILNYKENSSAECSYV